MTRKYNTIGLLALLVVACTPEPTPKPRGYFRIDLPEQAYRNWTDSSTLATEIPVYAKVGIRDRKDEARWFDVRFRDQRATVHLTWSPVNGNLQALIEDAHLFKRTHQAKAARIRSERLLNDSARVYGNLFEIDGNVASPVVFYVTDSTTNFLYGALYFDVRPNADSLAPVVTRLRADLRHMLATLRWK